MAWEVVLHLWKESQSEVGIDATSFIAYTDVVPTASQITNPLQDCFLYGVLEFAFPVFPPSSQAKVQSFESPPHIASLFLWVHMGYQYHPPNSFSCKCTRTSRYQDILDPRASNATTYPLIIAETVKHPFLPEILCQVADPLLSTGLRQRPCVGSLWRPPARASVARLPVQLAPPPAAKGWQPLNDPRGDCVLGKSSVFTTLEHLFNSKKQNLA